MSFFVCTQVTGVLVLLASLETSRPSSLSQLSLSKGHATRNDIVDDIPRMVFPRIKGTESRYPGTGYHNIPCQACDEQI